MKPQQLILILGDQLFDIVDGLYWRIIDKKRGFMRKNPRLSMVVSRYDRMGKEKKNASPPPPKCGWSAAHLANGGVL